MWEIKNKYGLRDKKKGDLWAWGTNDLKKVRAMAKAYGAEVVNYDLIGRKFEAEGIPVKYGYKKRRC